MAAYGGDAVNHLFTRTVTIVPRAASTVDAWGDELPDSGTRVETRGYLYQQSGSENVDGQTIGVSGWLLLLPAGTVIDDTDRVTVADLEGTFEVVGPPRRPWRPATGEHHVEVVLKKVDG